MRFGALAVVFAAGLLSRVAHTGWVVIDKYLGDALYAAMVFLLIPGRGVLRRAGYAMAVMPGLEVFQLTGVPARMVQEGGLILTLAGRVLGTVFGWGDLVAYAVGIVAIVAEEGRKF